MDTPLYVLDAPGLAKLAGQMAAILRADVGLRRLQGGNAPQCKVFTQGTLAATAIVLFAEAQNQNVQYTSAVVMFQDTAGRARFRIDGGLPAASGIGFPIPAGGGIFTINGIGNILNFKMIAETGNTLDFAYGLFV